MNGVVTPNEVRHNYDYAPLPDGNELRAINVSPELARQNERDKAVDDKREKKPTKTDDMSVVDDNKK